MVYGMKMSKGQTKLTTFVVSGAVAGGITYGVLYAMQPRKPKDPFVVRGAAKAITTFREKLEKDKGMVSITVGIIVGLLGSNII